MEATMKSISIGEKMAEHKLVMGTDDSKAKWHKVAKDTLYDYNPPLEDSIKTTWKNLKAAEDKLGVTFEDANFIGLKEDPITSSLGKVTQYLHPDPLDDPWAPKKINYPVVNFGPDPDIVSTQNSIAITESQLGHKLVMGTADSKAKWHIVAKDTLYDYHPKLDGDVIVTNRNIEAAENTLGVVYGA